jgi:hypothetical protein
MKIRKTVLAVVILSKGGEQLEFDDLEELGRMINDGEASGELIGKHTEADSVVIEKIERIQQELTKIGDDGTFFGDLDLDD